jgi:sugar phosphate isomerase/epimerase
MEARDDVFGGRFAAAFTEPGSMKLACQEQHIPGRTLVDKWRFCQEHGFDGIELRGADGFRFRERLPELRTARQAGVVMPSVCPATDHFIGDFDAERRRDAVAQMKSLLSVMAEIGGLGAMTPAAWGMFSRRLPPFEPPRPPEQDREVLVEALTELGEHAAREGVVVWLEPLNRYEDHMVNRLEQAADLGRATGSDAVQVVGDLYHMNIEERDPAQAIRDTGAVLSHVQIGDSNRLQPGAGHLDFAGAFAALADIGYGGYLAMECGVDGDPRQVLPAVAAFVRRHLPASAAHD